MIKFTPQTKISEILQTYPGSEVTLIQNGMRCTRCHMAQFESLEQGLQGHGMDLKKIKKIMRKINKNYENYQKNIKKFGLSLTPEAKMILDEIIKKRNKGKDYLRIKMIDEGQYEIDFQESKKEGDLEIILQKISFILEKNLLDKIKGIEIDYLKTDQREGFVITKG